MLKSYGEFKKQFSFLFQSTEYLTILYTIGCTQLRPTRNGVHYTVRHVVGDYSHITLPLTPFVRRKIPFV